MEKANDQIERSVFGVLQSMRLEAGVPGAVPPVEGLRFAAQGQLPCDRLRVDVDGVGELAGAAGSGLAAALHGASQPAPFGHRDQTLLDTAVRHTGEIDADVLSLHWAPGAFAQLQADVAQALGVTRLQAQLHKLLVYGEGQFFKPHQDTQKLPNMVATLVVVWPSAHIGGELRVRLGDEEAQMKSQQLEGGRDLKWFAFYADCRHEVLPVEAGWRIALTFDLLLPEGAAPEVSAHPPLRAALRERFADPSTHPSAEPPSRSAPWVLLLDHEYTEHGLRWPLLKGADAARANALRAAAKAEGLVVHLALMELHEVWSAEVNDSYNRRYRSDHPRESDMEPGELICDDSCLDFWVDEHDQVVSRQTMSLDIHNVCSFIDTGREHLTEQEYEGYMGNYGETLEYWYRRGALVIRSPLAMERDRFVLDIEGAFADLCALAGSPEAGAGVAVTQRVMAAKPMLSKYIGNQGRSLLASCVPLAAVMTDDAAALAFMGAFSMVKFLPEDAKALSRLECDRGAPWMCQLVQAWTDTSRSDRASPYNFMSRHEQIDGDGLPLWPRPLLAFTQACLAEQCSTQVVSAWLAAHLKTLLSYDAALLALTPATRQSVSVPHLRAACELAATLSQVPDEQRLLETLLTHVVDNPLLYPMESLAPLVLAVGPARQDSAQAQALHPHVVAALREALDNTVRGPKDFGLRRMQWVCRCADCSPALLWAESALERPLMLALAEARRRHVQSSLEAAGAGLTFDTIRQGSPHKLSLTKPRNLHAKDQLRAQRLQSDLDLLLAMGTER